MRFLNPYTRLGVSQGPGARIIGYMAKSDILVHNANRRSIFFRSLYGRMVFALIKGGK